mgnify:FL=1
MDNITSRTNYLNKELVDDIAQYDMGSFFQDGYDFGKCQYMFVRKQDECRPDILSYRAYGTANYWHFIMWFNSFMDPWNDLVEGQVIKYPPIQKVRDFFKWRLRKTKDNTEKSK